MTRRWHFSIKSVKKIFRCWSSILGQSGNYLIFVCNLLNPTCANMSVYLRQNLFANVKARRRGSVLQIVKSCVAVIFVAFLHFNVAKYLLDILKWQKYFSLKIIFQTYANPQQVRASRPFLNSNKWYSRQQFQERGK